MNATCARCHQPIKRGTGTGQLHYECETRAEAERRMDREDRAHRLYWERVDNYRELGYDPN